MNNNFNTPAADKLRPSSFDEMAGQEKLVGKNGILRKMAESGKLSSVIFYGPPGTGKTTAATILAEGSGRELYRLNATTASLSDVREVANAASGIGRMGGVVLYLDEIQYFNKKQQQSLLQYIEDGSITLIASTTENPYYYIYDALLSRCSVFEFKPVPALEMIPFIKRAISFLEEQRNFSIQYTEEGLKKIAYGSKSEIKEIVDPLAYQKILSYE